MQYYGFSLVTPGKEGHAVAVAETLRFVELADSSGLDGWLFAEHHGQPELSVSSTPNLLIAAASQRTSRIRLGTMVTVLPFHHPVHVAEEIRMLDVLSNGRLEAGFGRGHLRSEQALFGVDREKAAEMFDVSVDLITRLLAGETVDYETPWWSGKAATAVPDGVQARIPCWLTAVSDTSLEKAARLGMDCATALLIRKVADERMETYQRHWDAYQPGQSGRGRFAITTTVAVSKSRDEALASVGKLIADRQAHFGRAISDVPGTDDPSYAGHRATYAEFVSATLTSLIDDGLLIAGSVDECRRQVAEIRDRGVNTLICTFQHAGLSAGDARRSFELFMNDVVPFCEQTGIRSLDT
jgi:alkanesulfonate monooxygenase SsuD/methylene tetrahydromethanopterin reductase-like flavin-dependent oxidoreductase (luciferase family)